MMSLMVSVPIAKSGPSGVFGDVGFILGLSTIANPEGVIDGIAGTPYGHHGHNFEGI